MLALLALQVLFVNIFLTMTNAELIEELSPGKLTLILKLFIHVLRSQQLLSYNILNIDAMV